MLLYGLCLTQNGWFYNGTHLELAPTWNAAQPLRCIKRFGSAGVGSVGWQAHCPGRSAGGDVLDYARIASIEEVKKRDEHTY